MSRLLLLENWYEEVKTVIFVVPILLGNLLKPCLVAAAPHLQSDFEALPTSPSPSNDSASQEVTSISISSHVLISLLVS